MPWWGTSLNSPQVNILKIYNPPGNAKSEKHRSAHHAWIPPVPPSSARLLLGMAVPQLPGQLSIKRIRYQQKGSEMTHH